MTSQRKSDSEYADTLGGRLGEDKSTRSQARLPTQNDEERLLPGNTIRSDPAAVKIVPGSAGQKYGRKSKLNIQAFKPYDTISRRVRESGPVRARGKADQSSSSQRSTRGIVTRPENGAVHDDQERPSKRRRRESQDTFRGVISIPDDDIMEQIPPDNTYLGGHSTRLSPALSQHSDRTKLRDPSSKRNRVDEYREVERGIKPPRTPKRGSIKYTQLFSDEYYEERFTEDAARERRAMASDVEPESAKLAWPDRAGKHEAIESVEVHSPPSKEQQDGPNLDCPSVATDQNHPDSSRDSPDELQGGATVQPAPMLLKRGREKETSNSMSEPKEHPGAVGRLASPSDIQPTVFTGSSQNHRKSDKRRKAPTSPTKLAVKCFYATFVRFGSDEHRSSEAFEINVETKESTATTETTITHPWNGERISLGRLDKVVQGKSPSRRVRLLFSRKGGLDNEMDMEFSTSEEQETLCNLLQRLLHGQHVQLLYRRDDWLENSFMRRSEDLAEKKAKEAKHLGEDKPKSISYRAPEVAKRVKLSDSLQDTYENTAGQIQPSDTASVECSKSATETLGNLIAPSTRELPSNEQVADKGSVKKLFPGSSFSNRATRSMSRRAPATTVVCDDEVEDDGSQLKAEEKDKKWHKPLVYPRFGKKKAEVDAQDRERLRDNEFLNDNLIGFYIRFLEDHLERTNNEVAKRVYFFNSYFFATLTNVKGRRNINYEGVQKWTRAVDIFAFDYIVVPINENAHWYVAIICNLPNLPGIADKNTENRQPSECDKDSSAAPESEGREIPETPEPIELPAGKPVKANDNRNSEPAKDEATRQSFETMSLSDKEELEDRAPDMPPTEWPEQEENLIFSPAKFSSPAAKVESTEKASVMGTSELAASPNKGSKKKKAKPSGKPGGAKFDIRQATIITFDSLDLSRSPTISNLRDYLYEEAKSKRGIEIDRSLIRGMRARAIPLQSNYSDCGLYLLAYIEKFVQDPDLFVRKLLRREMKTQDDWPLLKSGILRRRLRDFLDDLYDEQALSGSEKASEKGVLADRYPISYLLGSSASTSAQNEECNDSQQLQLKVSSSTEVDAQKHPLGKRRPASNRSSPATSDGNQNLKTEKDGTHQIAPSLKNPVVEITVPNVSDKIDDKVVEVQVPNSQEQAQEASSCSSKILEKDKSPSDQAAMKPVDHEVCPVENKETKKPKQPAKLPTVEVQIIPPSYQDSIKNQHSAKQKPK